MAGAGINADNLPIIAANTQVKEVHFSARKELKSEMIFRKSEVFMGKVYEPDEYHQKVTDAGRVQEIIQSLVVKSSEHFSH
jgi:copper homeostasis protein